MQLIYFRSTYLYTVPEIPYNYFLYVLSALLAHSLMWIYWMLREVVGFEPCTSAWGNEMED